jgi:hypothetical protein
MTRIAISQAAFDAIAKTPPLGSVAVEGEPNDKVESVIYLDDRVADRLVAKRGPGGATAR